MTTDPTPPAGRDDLRDATCKHCGQPIVFKPYFADGKQRWWHPGNGLGIVICQSRPDDYPDGEWPTAEPAPSDLQGSPTAGSDDLRDRIRSTTRAARALKTSVNEIADAVTRERLDLLAEADPLMLRDEAIALLERAEQAEDLHRSAVQAYGQLAERHADAEAQRDRWRQRAEQAEGAVERARAEHAAIHAEADEFERTHNPDCECEIAPTSRNVADRLLAALDPPAKEDR